MQTKPLVRFERRAWMRRTAFAVWQLQRGGSMKLRRFAILSSVFLCFSATAPALARTLVVDNNIPPKCPKPDFTSIQLAVAVALPGDKTLVCPGTYEETVVVHQHDLRIEAQAAPGE